jgi:ribosomal protein S18 acetylase RimI-like enzyme
MIRPARQEDFTALQEIERAAGRAFAAIGMTAIADDEPFSLEELREFSRDGNAWVYDVAGRPAAYAVVQWVDGVLHLEQVSVHPEYAGRRIGAELIDHLAGSYDTPALTLTTFRDVPWNAPYYERLGFRVLAEAEVTPGLRDVRAVEAAHGLDAWPRVCMRRHPALNR